MKKLKSKRRKSIILGAVAGLVIPIAIIVVAVLIQLDKPVTCRGLISNISTWEDPEDRAAILWDKPQTVHDASGRIYQREVWVIYPAGIIPENFLDGFSGNGKEVEITYRPPKEVKSQPIVEIEKFIVIE